MLNMLMFPLDNLFVNIHQYFSSIYSLINNTGNVKNYGELSGTEID